MRRREFISLLGSGVAGWPLAARAQQADRVRRIGVLINLAIDDPEGEVRLAAFRQGLSQLGWSDGGNVRIDTRWGAGDADRYRRYAAELVALAPDVILAVTSNVVAALQRETRTVPIVFVQAIDPVGTGLVASLARPGRQHHRFHHFRIRAQPEMASTAQGDRAPRDASGSSA